jgi:hypothetical protein
MEPASLDSFRPLGSRFWRVTTPDRRRRGKNDDLDAQNAAHAAFLPACGPSRPDDAMAWASAPRGAPTYVARPRHLRSIAAAGMPRAPGYAASQVPALPLIQPKALATLRGNRIATPIHSRSTALSAARKPASTASASAVINRARVSRGVARGPDPVPSRGRRKFPPSPRGCSLSPRQCRTFRVSTPRTGAPSRSRIKNLFCLDPSARPAREMGKLLVALPLSRRRLQILGNDHERGV